MVLVLIIHLCQGIHARSFHTLEPGQAYAEWNSGFTVLFQTTAFRRRAAWHGPSNSTNHVICYSLYSLFFSKTFLFPGSSPFITLNPSQINSLNYFFFPIVPSFATSNIKFNISDTPKWVTLAVHSITGTITLVLLTLGGCTSWGASAPPPRVCEA